MIAELLWLKQEKLKKLSLLRLRQKQKLLCQLKAAISATFCHVSITGGTVNASATTQAIGAYYGRNMNGSIVITGDLSGYQPGIDALNDK